MVAFREFDSTAPAHQGADGPEVPLVCDCLCRDGRLQLDDAPPFDEFLTPDICARSALLSLADVVFIDTRSISWLLEVHKRFARGGGKLAVHSVRPQALESLTFLHMNHVLNIAEDETAALRLLQDE